jgi:hypothetical protein
MNLSTVWEPSGSSPTQSNEQNYDDHNRENMKESHCNNTRHCADENTNDVEEEEECSTRHQHHDQNAITDATPPLDVTTKGDKASLSSPERVRAKTSKGQISTRFSDIIGHGAVKLRLDEVLLPMALPPALADSILTGTYAYIHVVNGVALSVQRTPQHEMFSFHV